jgi:hypothetical protein
MLLVGVGAVGSWAGRAYILNASDSAVYTAGHGRAELELWSVLIGLFTGYAVAAALVMAQWLRRVLALFRPRVTWVWLRWVAVIALINLPVQVAVGGFVGLTARHPLPNGRQTTVITVVGLVTALPGLVSFLAIRNLAADDRQWQEPPRCLIVLVTRLRHELRRVLGVLGLFLTLIVIATAARRRALLALDGSTVFPPEFVILYGLVFAGLLALLHLAASTAIDRRSERLLAQFAPVPSPDTPDLDAQLQRRHNIEGLLGVGVGWQQSFQNGVIVFAPLLTALIGTAVPGK